jgi:hypothetical protein
MKNKLLFLLFLLVPAALAAQEHNPSPKANYTPGRWYAGVNYGLQRFSYVGSYRNVMGYGGYRLGRHFSIQLGAIYQQIGNDERSSTYIDPPYYADGTRAVTTSENLFGVPLWLRASLLRPERRLNVYLLTGLTAAWQNRQEQYVIVAGGTAVEQGSRQVRSTGLYYQIGLGVQGRVWNRFFLTTELMPYAKRLGGNPDGSSPSLPYNVGVRYEFK